MESQIKEPLDNIERPKKTFNLYLLILLILILIISVTIIIILIVKLNSRSNDYDNIKKEYENYKTKSKDYEKIKKEYEELKPKYEEINTKYEELKPKYEELNTRYEELNTNYEELDTKYTNQNDTLNDFFNTFQNLISTTNITNANISKDDYVNVKEKVEAAKGFEPGTYDIVTNELINFENGYQVAFETTSRNSRNYYSNEEYDNMVYKLSSLFGINAHIGVYGVNPHISFYIEDKNTSLSIAALFNQISVWDWGNNTEILNTFHQPKYY